MAESLETTFFMQSDAFAACTVAHAILSRDETRDDIRPSAAPFQIKFCSSTPRCVDVVISKCHVTPAILSRDFVARL